MSHEIDYIDEVNVYHTHRLPQFTTIDKEICDYIQLTVGFLHGYIYLP